MRSCLPAGPACGVVMKSAVVFGAGAIGRGFIGPLFSQSGYEVTFVEADAELVRLLNQERGYPLRLFSEKSGVGRIDQHVAPVRAIPASCGTAVAEAVSRADLMATATGISALPHVAERMACGLSMRWKSESARPVNVILCENMLKAGPHLEGLVRGFLPEEEQCVMKGRIGFAAASIGRMVPIMTDRLKDGNPLRICAEPYSCLPVDLDGLVGDIPEILGMTLHAPFTFIMDRKLLLHNMGHALAAWLGALDGCATIRDAVMRPEVRRPVRGAMTAVAKALSLAYGEPEAELVEHVEDLIRRFENPFLEDTPARVGRDLRRKLSPDERAIGALCLCERHGIETEDICQGIAAALRFRDPAGTLDAFNVPSSSGHAAQINRAMRILKEVCRLPEDSRAYARILHRFSDSIQKQPIG